MSRPVTSAAPPHSAIGGAANLDLSERAASETTFTVHRNGVGPTPFRRVNYTRGRLQRMRRVIVGVGARQVATLVLGLGVATGVGARRAAPQEVGERFRDCKVCPEMVVVPAGSFMMGTPEEVGVHTFEQPQHRVTIESPFAVGVYEVMFDEWDACAHRGGCGRYRPSDLGWGRGRHPAINVSWEDAWSYADWLTERTGEEYRLLSEAEWEYVARAGTTTARYWGETTEGQCRHANGYDAGAHAELQRDYHGPAACRDGWTFTAPVGSYQPNGFGLHDVLGNVREWVDDCFKGSYEGAPTDGSAWVSEDCVFPVLRGGSWLEHPGLLYSASRMRTVHGGAGGNNRGFRVARTLRPASARELRPEIQLERLMVKADRQIRAQQHDGALRTLDRILELQETHGVELPEAIWMRRAEVAMEAGLYAEAKAAATRYLGIVGRGGGQPALALELLDRAVAAACTPERMTETLESVQSCLALGADPNGADTDGRSTVDWAAVREDTGIMAALLEAGADSALAAAAAAEAKRAATQPGTIFRDDCIGCPEMVVVPAGSFMMGSPSTEEGRDDFEGPQHLVTIGSRFAVGVYEVTLAEWEACMRRGGCWGFRPEDEGWGRGRRPVINVNWEHAREYVRWLSEETGKEYRLLSEAEWEYVARAGAQTARYWGDSESEQCEHANGADQDTRQGQENVDWTTVSCSDGYVGTAPVGMFQSNAFGLHDVLGNVWEWTQDCGNRSYSGAPTDGSAWQTGDCDVRVFRGSSWADPPSSLRSATRNAGSAGYRNFTVGFRVARTMNSR